MKAFFFAPESPRPLALMRIVLGLVLIVEAGVRWPSAIELYSTAGLPMPPFPRLPIPARSLNMRRV